MDKPDKCIDLKSHYLIFELTPATTKVHFHKTNAKYSKLKYNLRYWVKKWYGNKWFTITVTKGYSKFSMSVVVVENRFIVIDVIPNFLPFPLDDQFVKNVVRIAFLNLYKMCLQKQCKGVFIDPELPFDACALGVEDLIGEIKHLKELAPLVIQ